MPKIVSRHTLETANEVLLKKGLKEFLSIVKVNEHTLNVLDKDYGEYVADKKALCDLTKFPIHRKRQHKNKIEKAKSKHIGRTIKGFKILDLFYGPDKGYKNRGFICEVLNPCGHSSFTTMALLINRLETVNCVVCSKVKHGERSKINGIRKTRTSTYTWWANNSSSLPDPYKSDYTIFLDSVGEKPTKAILQFIDNKPLWKKVSMDLEQKNLQMIASAIRQIFRYSEEYKSIIENSRVETEEGSKYRCASCGDLFIRSHVEVDHLEPIQPIDGSPLIKETLIGRIWTNQVQVLDTKCHNEKSQKENEIRRNNKKLLLNAKI